MNEQPDITAVCESTLIITALKHYSEDLRAKYDEDKEELKLLLQYIGTVYRKYLIVAKTPVTRDALGNLTVKQSQQRGRYELN